MPEKGGRGPEGERERERTVKFLSDMMLIRAIYIFRNKVIDGLKHIVFFLGRF
jgi:hypothetical protein